jgi:hypothetical protein
VAAYQAAWGDEDEAADQKREVGCEVCGKGAAEGVADEGEGRGLGPGDRRGLEAQEDLGGVEGRVVAVGAWWGAGRVAAAKEVWGEVSTVGQEQENADVGM